MKIRKITDFAVRLTRKYYEWYYVLTIDLAFIGAIIGLSGVSNIWLPEMENSRWWQAIYIGLIAGFVLILLKFDKLQRLVEEFYREMYGKELVPRVHPVWLGVVIFGIAAVLMFGNKQRTLIVGTFKIAAGAHAGFSAVMLGYLAYCKLRQLGRKWFGLGARSGIEIEMTEPEWYVRKTRRMQAEMPEQTPKMHRLKPSGKVNVKVNKNTGEREVVIELEEVPEY